MNNPYQNDIVKRIDEYFEEFKMLFKGSVDEDELYTKIKGYQDDIANDINEELKSTTSDIKSLLRASSYVLINQEFTKFYKEVEEYFST